MSRRLGVVALATALAAGAIALVLSGRDRDRVLDASGYAAALPSPGTFSYSRYIPGKGTEGSTPGLPPEAVSLRGEELPFPLYVVSDVGRYLLRLSAEGRVEWVLLLSKRCRGVAAFPGEVLYPRGSEIVRLESRTGAELGRFPVEKVGHLNFVNQTEGRLVVGYSGVGPGRVRVYERLGEGWVLKGSNPLSSNGARHAGTKGGLLYVADTFGHRCYVVDLASSRLVWERPAYFPCAMAPTSDGGWVVAEEHANRVLKVRDGGGSAEVVFCCPDPLYADPAATPDMIRAREAEKIFKTADGRLIGLASELASGENTLYSPNGVCLAEDGRLVVADTDNHRLVVIRGGKIVTIVRGFNNPVKVSRALD